MNVHGRKPGVIDLLLTALGKEQVERVEAALRLHAVAVTLQMQNALIGIVEKQRVARILIQGGDQTVRLTVPEAAPGDPVQQALLIRIGNEVVVAVAVKGEFIDHKLRNAVHAADAVLLRVFRTVGPGLVAVQEDAFAVLHGNWQLGADVPQHGVRRQVTEHMKLVLCFRLPVQRDFLLPAAAVQLPLQSRHDYFPSAWRARS